MFANNSTRVIKTERLLAVLADGRWHSTRELVRRVGHTFAGAKFKLVGHGYSIEKRAHPDRVHQYQYRRLDLPNG